MGVVPKSVWQQQNGALRRKLKNCQTDICTCLKEYMDQQMDGGDGMNQTWDNMTNQHAQRNQMDGHWQKFDNSRSGYQNAHDLWDENGCGGGGPAHAAWPAHKEATMGDALDEYEQSWGQPMPAGGPSTLARVGYFAGGVVLGAGAVAGVLFVFDGPASEAVLGTAALGAFGAAFQ